MSQITGIRRQGVVGGGVDRPLRRAYAGQAAPLTMDPETTGVFGLLKIRA
jgi:hypothetical protein